MLYNSSNIDKKYDDFLFDVEPYNTDIDVRDIAAIEDFYEHNGYLPENCVTDFLNWIIYRARKNICTGVESPLYSSFTGRCAKAQAFFDAILNKLKFENISFNIGDVLGTNKFHSVSCVQIPSVKNDEITNRLFLLDPTFRQFCLVEENRFERYYEEPRWAVAMSTPHPAYFLNLTEKGQQFATDLIHFGYFEITEDSLKTYFDAFALYTTPRENYIYFEDIGKISITEKSGLDYWNLIIDNIAKPNGSIKGLDLDTAKDIVGKDDKKLLNELRGIVESKYDYKN